MLAHQYNRNLLRLATEITRWGCVTQASSVHTTSGLLQERIIRPSSTDDPEYIQKSVLNSMHFQKGLPRLPVPTLEDTCRRYLASQKPLLTEEQYAITEKHVSAFSQEAAPIQEDLVAVDKANKHTSYITGMWTDMYLRDRRPVVLTHNPFLCYNDDPRPEYNDQLVRTTNIIVSSIRFLKSLRENILDPEIFHLRPKKSDTEFFRNIVRPFPGRLAWYLAFLYKAFPLDMSQYKNLFNTTRIPRQDKDEIFLDETAKHLVVIRNGHFYTVKVVEENGSITPATEIMSAIKTILDDKRTPPDHPIAYFTTEDRNTWASLREQFIAAGNADALNKIDSAIFTISLDDTSYPEKYPVQLLRDCLHGDGTNRWFDKSFSLIITKDGRVNLNMEHAWGDGVSVLRFIVETHRDSIERPAISPATVPNNGNVDSTLGRLEFKLSPGVKAGIDEAKRKFHEKLGRLDMQLIPYTKFARRDLKPMKISADGVMQLAIQLAYYRIHGRAVPTYESCSTSAFRHGRTETLRPATAATLKCSEAFTTHVDKMTAGELHGLMKEACNIHAGNTRDAAMGQGWDRHLYALKKFASDSNMKMPALFTDPNYDYINNIILSTSSLSGEEFLAGGFGPPTGDCFGIGYGMRDEILGFIVASYAPHNCTEFMQALMQSVDDVFEVLNGRHPTKS